MDPVRQFLSDFGGTSVIDLACGDGWFTERLCDGLRRCESLVGIDVDAAEIDEARDALGARHVRFERGTAMDLRFADASFDVVAVSNALHHICHPMRGLREAHRVLAPSGVLLVHEMTREVAGKARENARAFHHLKARVDRLLGISHHETLPEERILGLLEESGFSVQRVDRYDPEPQTDPEAIDAQIEFLRDYITHVMEHPEFASIRKDATLLAERIRVDGFAPATELLIAAGKE